MINQSTFGGHLQATSALLPGFPNNAAHQAGLVRTLLPGAGHPNVSLGLEVRKKDTYHTKLPCHQLGNSNFWKNDVTFPPWNKRTRSRIKVPTENTRK